MGQEGRGKTFHTERLLAGTQRPGDGVLRMACKWCERRAGASVVDWESPRGPDAEKLREAENLAAECHRFRARCPVCWVM